MSLVTTEDAAQILGVTAVRVRQLMADGRLVAEKCGQDHVLEDREVQRCKRHGRRSGPEGGPAAGWEKRLAASGKNGHNCGGDAKCG